MSMKKKLEESLESTLTHFYWTGEEIQKNFDLDIIKWAMENGVDPYQAVGRPAFFVPKDVIDGFSARALKLKELALS